MGSDCAPGRAGSRLVLANSKQPRPAEDGAPSRSESAASGGARFAPDPKSRRIGNRAPAAFPGLIPRRARGKQGLWGVAGGLACQCPASRAVSSSS